MTPSDSSTESLKPATPNNIVPPPPGSSRTIIVKEYDFFKVVQDYLDRAARNLDIADFVRTILKSKPGDKLTFTVERSGEVSEVEVTVRGI